MKKIIERIKNIDIIELLILLIPFLYGTFYDFSVFIITIILQIIILIFYIKNKKINVKINSALICFIVLFIFSSLTTIWAVDKNDAFLGTLRYLSIVIFNILIMQFSSNRKEKMLESISYSALFMLIISILLGFIPSLKNFIYTPNGRLMGFFPYANTFALYLLIGMIVITNKRKDKYALFITLIFLIGILLTGSRTSFILATIYIIYTCFDRQNTQRKYYILTYLGLIILTVFYIIIADKLETIGRIFEISPNAGTLIERFLYWKDSIKLIISNPFGLGYMGYSYKIYEIQTGAYITKFVHNEYLQMMLDIGIIPTIIFILTLIKSFISKKNIKTNKIILLVIMIHIILDLDLQSIIILYIISLCLEEKTYKEYKFDLSITYVATISIISLIYIYYAMACFMHYIGKNEKANEMLSNFTEAKVELMKIDNIEKVHKYAEEILETNKYEPQTYNANAIYYLLKGDYEKMIESKKKEISLDKYNIKVYEEYALMLKDIIQMYSEKGDKSNVNKYTKYIIEIEEMLENVKNNTDDLAYKITDNINLELDQEIKNYITYIKEASK